MPFGSRDRAPEPAKIETIAEAEAPRERETPAPSETIVDVEAPEPQPPAASPPTPVSRPVASAEMTGAQAEATLRGFVTSRNYYGITTECVGIQNRGYENVGYTLEVWDRCAGGGASRLLGRWRVDARTREVFRQREDGRYLRP